MAASSTKPNSNAAASVADGAPSSSLMELPLLSLLPRRAAATTARWYTAIVRSYSSSCSASVSPYAYGWWRLQMTSDAMVLWCWSQLRAAPNGSPMAPLSVTLAAHVLHMFLCYVLCVRVVMHVYACAMQIHSLSTRMPKGWDVPPQITSMKMSCCDPSTAPERVSPSQRGVDAIGVDVLRGDVM